MCDKHQHTHSQRSCNTQPGSNMGLFYAMSYLQQVYPTWKMQIASHHRLLSKTVDSHSNETHTHLYKKKQPKDGDRQVFHGWSAIVTYQRSVLPPTDSKSVTLT